MNLAYDDAVVLESMTQYAPEHLTMHLEGVRDLARSWAQVFASDEDEAQLFAQSAYLHDIGKLMIPERILLSPMRLTPREYRIMQQHVRLGVQMLAGNVDERVIALVLMHHERLDGKGYPHGFSGDDIPMLVRRLSVVDAFMAMTEGRVYRATLTNEQAYDELRRCSGTQFDTAVVEEFVRWHCG